MTTKVTIEPAGHTVLIETIDDYKTPGGLVITAQKQEVILSRDYGGKPQDFYITNTRSLFIREIEADDPREREARGLKIENDQST